MTVIAYTPGNSADSVNIELEERESVLLALLRNGFDIPNGCRAGACQSCLLQTTETDIPAKAQVGLKATQKLAGYFLSCSCYPSNNFTCSAAEELSQKTTARLIEKTPLNDQVFRLRLQSDTPYQPGQYFTLWKDNSTARCYSVASIADDGFLEFHIKNITDGAFSAWALDQLQPDDQLDIQGPLGECYYLQKDPNQPLLLCGIGTGLAPLYGIAREALNKGHSGKITLILGSLDASNFYYVDQLIALVKQYDNFSVVFVSQHQTLKIETSPQITSISGDIYSEVKALFPSLTGFQVYLCGAQSFVRKMKKTCFLQGVAMLDIAADAFIPFQSS